MRRNRDPHSTRGSNPGFLRLWIPWDLRSPWHWPPDPTRGWTSIPCLLQNQAQIVGDLQQLLLGTAVVHRQLVERRGEEPAVVADLCVENPSHLDIEDQTRGNEPFTLLVRRSRLLQFLE